MIARPLALNSPWRSAIREYPTAAAKETSADFLVSSRYFATSRKGPPDSPMKHQPGRYPSVAGKTKTTRSRGFQPKYCEAQINDRPYARS
jgi:hypothetical protein